MSFKTKHPNLFYLIEITLIFICGILFYFGRNLIGQCFDTILKIIIGVTIAYGAGVIWAWPESKK